MSGHLLDKGQTTVLHWADVLPVPNMCLHVPCQAPHLHTHYYEVLFTFEAINWHLFTTEEALKQPAFMKTGESSMLTKLLKHGITSVSTVYNQTSMDGDLIFTCNVGKSKEHMEQG